MKSMIAVGDSAGDIGMFEEAPMPFVSIHGMNVLSPMQTKLFAKDLALVLQSCSRFFSTL